MMFAIAADADADAAMPATLTPLATRACAMICRFHVAAIFAMPP